MKTTLNKILTGRQENHILPFFWQHGEDDDVLLTELHRIYDCGIRAVCVEARPHPHFGEEPWFEDLGLIIAECKKLGMDFWLLDDAQFPTGRANGLLWEKYPHLGRRLLTERHMDLSGPVRDHGAMVSHWLEDGDRLIGIVACKRYPDREDQRMTGEAVDLTSQYDEETGMVFFTLPDGFWRIFFVIDKPFANQYVDMLREDSVHVLIEGVYEPHYERLKDYVGGTFRGFFSDEPFLMHSVRMLTGNETYSEGRFPWNDYVKEDLAVLHGEAWLCDLPALWFPSDRASRIRVNYMDVVTRRFEKCFSRQIGDWCRSHNMEYIGHVIEDHNLHTGFSGGGHYFRSLNGQDMAGIDVVLDQILPGMAHDPHKFKNGQIETDFFHFGLAKLGSSHAHIQPLKRGRTMCEIFGAYGWAGGVKMMKWLTDHMLVRGVNEFVPHAFSPKYPDPDCPPHFYARGHNPQYRSFGKLMGYMNRVADVLSDGPHHAPVAVYYHAQAEWCGEPFMRFHTPGRVLLENQIDFDVIPEDYLTQADVEGGKLCLNGESYHALVLPYAKALPAAMIENIAALAKAGLPVWCIDDLPDVTVEGETLSPALRSLFREVPLSALADHVRDAQFADAVFAGKCRENLRCYHYSKNGGHAVFLTNEGVRGTVDGILTLKDFDGGVLVRYDPMDNRMAKDMCGKEIPLCLEPYGAVMLFFGELGDLSGLPIYEESTLSWVDAQVGKWNISFAPAEEYDPDHPDMTVFGNAEETDTLYNIVRRHKKYAGFVKYETTLTVSEDGRCVLDLGEVGETAWVWLNGERIGDAIAPPYRFAAQGHGEMRLTVVTTSHLGYREQDRFSAYLPFEPVGLLGPVKIGRKAE